MNRFLKSFVTISALSSLVIAPVIFSGGQADAAPQPKKGTNASYVGAGIGGQVTNGGQINDAANLGGNLTGRVKLGPTPLSARAQILWNNDATAIVPQLSVDVPIAKKTNVYVAGGYSFVEQDNASSPLGNKNSIAVTAGVEREVGKGFLLYGNTTAGINGYKNSSATPLNVGGGVAIQFK